MRWTTLALLPLLAAATVACETEAEPGLEADAGNDVEATELTAGQTPSTMATITRQEIERINQEHVDRYNQDDVAGFTEVYTEDAVLYPPGQPAIEGRQAIQQFWQGGHDQAGIRDVNLTTEEFQAMGDQAWEVGTADYTTNEGPVSGRYMVIWQRGPDGEWRWHRDLMSPGPSGQ